MKHHAVALACWLWMVLVAYVNYRVDPWGSFILQAAITFLGLAMPISQVAAYLIRTGKIT